MGLLARILVVLFLASSGLAHAVQPDEVLQDPAMEARARALSAELRCMVCQNQSIDDSNAELARDLRVLVRDRIEAGDSDRQVIDYVVARYGEFVLLKPRLNARNLLLWAAPALLLVLGIAFALVQSRRRRPGIAGLTPQEKAEVDRLLKDKG